MVLRGGAPTCRKRRRDEGECPLRVNRAVLTSCPPRPVYPEQRTFPHPVGTSHLCRFCCRSRLRPWANGDSVSAGRFSAEARDDGAAQPGSRATFLLVLPC